MARKKTSKRRARSSRDTLPELKSGHRLKDFDPTPHVGDPKVVARALADCILENDQEGVLALLYSHLKAMNKRRVADRSGLSRQTLYNLLSPDADPRLSTIIGVVTAISTAPTSNRR